MYIYLIYFFFLIYNKDFFDYALTVIRIQSLQHANTFYNLRKHNVIIICTVNNFHILFNFPDKNKDINNL